MFPTTWLLSRSTTKKQMTVQLNPNVAGVDVLPQSSTNPLSKAPHFKATPSKAPWIISRLAPATAKWKYQFLLK